MKRTESQDALATADVLHEYIADYVRLGFNYDVASMLAWKRYVRRGRMGIRQL